MAEIKQFKMPDLAEGLTEADILEWHVKPGDTVEINQIIADVETAKAAVELPSPYEGIVTEVLVEAGTTVDVGTPIISVDVAPGGTAASGGGTPKEDLVPEPPQPVVGGESDAESYEKLLEEKKPKRQPVLVGYGIKESATKRRQRKRPAGQPSGAATPTTAGQVAVLVKPPVRKLAKDLGVDLTAVTGTGPQGSITRDDVHAAVSAPAAAPAKLTAIPSGPREERIPIKGTRKSTANAVIASAFTAPHVTEWLQVDVTEMMYAVKRLRTLPEFADVKVSPLLLVARALLLAVKRNPMVNSAWDEQAQEIVLKRYVNLGIAAATQRGLIVPNIKDAQDLSLPDLARALAGLTETARAGKTSLADMQGGTITITNVGVFGVDAGTPILTPGESAILAFGQVRDMPWVVEGQLAIRKVCTLALSFDHRIVDGDLGSAVLRDVAAMLEDPLRMVAWS